MVATRFLMLSLAAAVAVAGPCKPQSSSVIFSETTLTTALIESTSTAVPDETSTSEPTSTAIIESSVTSAAETTETTAVTTFTSAETTTEAATVPSVAAVPPQGITCPAAHGQCVGGFKIECGYIMTGGFSVQTGYLSTLDDCAAACDADSGCAGFSHNGVSCYLVSSSYTTAPADWITGKKEGCAQ
ncbi:uncharacterized protein FTJAE_4899 [Fusarium tjaetaba]|uniref:Apple domain-containing protein n=1 Tax=Fusarium tjaetaba TaxID=1567544 RepID=A0A8H5RWQ5_9HYPO|nr:uncharacterized protein FTJAE_4899 [Fusarium tjaetaba]KAF5639561.1 hypothetical protein FTJAE_4899 [Fusarium tjaetaba]